MARKHVFQIKKIIPSQQIKTPLPYHLWLKFRHIWLHSAWIIHLELSSHSKTCLLTEIPWWQSWRTKSPKLLCKIVIISQESHISQRWTRRKKKNPPSTWKNYSWEWWVNDPINRKIDTSGNKRWYNDTKWSLEILEM